MDSGEPDTASYLADGLRQLLDVVRASDLRELEIQDGDFSVRLHRSGPAGAHVAALDDESEALAPGEITTATIVSPLVGTFYRAGKPGMSPLVGEGSYVEEDTVVGIIEALHVLTDVHAGVRGSVTHVMATDGQPVEYGQVLFEVTVDG